MFLNLQCRIVGVIRKWVDNHFYDFEKAPDSDGRISRQGVHQHNDTEKNLEFICKLYSFVVDTVCAAKNVGKYGIGIVTSIQMQVN